MRAKDQIAQVMAARREAATLKQERQTDGPVVRLAHGRTLRRRTTWPGTAVPISISVLTYRQRAEAMAAGLTQLRARGIDDGKPAPEHVEPALSEHIIQILARALRDPESDELLFAAAEDLADTATEDEVSILFAEYADFRETVAPTLKELPPEEWQRFLSAIKKKEPESWSAIAYAWPQSWLLTTVDRLATSMSSSLPSISSGGESLSPAEDEQGPTSTDA
jgi:hypothetical protein